MNNPKEQAYDEHIAPLMTKIIALVKEHKINMFADFSLDDDPELGPLYCTTFIVDPAFDDDDGNKRMQAYHRITTKKPAFAAFTIITKGAKDLS